MFQTKSRTHRARAKEKAALPHCSCHGLALYWHAFTARHVLYQAFTMPLVPFCCPLAWCVFRRQLTSLLLRWTNAADTGGHHGSGNDPWKALPPAAAAPAKETAGLVAAGLKLVKTVCAKADSNKGQ